MKKYLALVISVLLVIIFICGTALAADNVMTPGEYDSKDAKITYSAPYDEGPGDDYYLGSISFCNIPGTYFEFMYKGTSAEIWGDKNYNHGKMEISLDGNLIETLDTYSAEQWPKTGFADVLYTVDTPDGGEHIVRVTIAKDKSAASGDFYLSFDKVVVKGSSEASTEAAAEATGIQAGSENPKTGDASGFMYFVLAAASGAGMVAFKLKKK